MSGQYVPPFVFSKAKTENLFVPFELNAFNNVRILGEQILHFLSCKLLKAALTGLAYGETTVI